MTSFIAIQVACTVLFCHALFGSTASLLYAKRTSGTQEVRFLFLDEPQPQSRLPQVLESRIQRPKYSVFARPVETRSNDGLENSARPFHHGRRYGDSRTADVPDRPELDDSTGRYPSRTETRNRSGLHWPRNLGRYGSLFDEYEKAQRRRRLLYNMSRAVDPGLVRLGVHRIWYPGDHLAIEVKLKPNDDSRSYVVVIAKTIPDARNLSRGGGGGGGEAGGAPSKAGAPGDAAGSPGVSVPKTQSMYTYRVPRAYLPLDPRHLFVTVLMVAPGAGVDMRPYKRYTLMVVIGDCRFLDQEEAERSSSCKTGVIAGKKEVLCLCKAQASTTRLPPTQKATTTTPPRLQIRERFHPRVVEEKRLFRMPMLTPVKNCSLAQRSYFHRLLQREYPLENITTAERLAVQIMQGEHILNNQSLYWTCNAFAPVDEDRVLSDKAKLRSLSIRRLEQILSRHYQACPLVAAGTVLAMQGPSAEVDFHVHEAALVALRKSVQVLGRLPTRTRSTVREVPSIIRSVLKGEAIILSHKGSIESREQLCNLSGEALSVMDDTVGLVMQTHRNAEGEAVYVSEGISLWYSKVNVEEMKAKERHYVKPRLMLTYDSALYGFSKTLSVVVSVYRRNPYYCTSSPGPISTDVVRPYIRDGVTGMRIRGPPDRRRTIQVSLAPDPARSEDASSVLDAQTMLIVKFPVTKIESSIVVQIHPEFVKYFFMAFVQVGKDPETKDLTADKLTILHPLASFVVIQPSEYKMTADDMMYVTFVPLVESSVKALDLKNVRYPFWHRNDMKIWYTVSVRQWQCVSRGDGSSGGAAFTADSCVLANVSRLGEIMCECQPNTTGIAGTAQEVTTSVNRKPLGNVTGAEGGAGEAKAFNFYFLQYLIPILLAALWVNFMVLLYWTTRIAEIDRQSGATAIAPENKPGNKEVYLLIFQTSYVQYAETTAKIMVELHGTEGTSGKFTLRDPRCNPYFLLAGSYNSLLITTTGTLGNIIVLSIFSDSEGTRPSWHLKKIDVFHEGKNEKFLFVVDKWLRFQDQDHADILPFVMGHGKMFKIMFGMNFPRIFRMCHLLVSVFAWPSGSRFSRVHRLITILFLGVLSMFLVMLLQGLQPQNRPEPVTFAKQIEVGCLTAVAVFVAGVILQIIFTFSKQLPPDKIRLSTRDVHADAAKTARITTTTKYTTYSRNPEIRIAYEVPEYRDETGAAGAKEQRSASLFDDRTEEGVLPGPCFHVGLLIALVLSVVLSVFMVPYGNQYGFDANVAWFTSLIIAVLLNNILIDVIKSVGVTGYVSSRKK
ncbi:uncharacterized protein LOC135388804 [Ornithodoros turicata]|uniref:uncharacterized protein LOC135388804 n=1 Tax=Ornithodoros turicata TaxID=34597 RepID=UPI00313914A3